MSIRVVAALDAQGAVGHGGPDRRLGCRDGRRRESRLRARSALRRQAICSWSCPSPAIASASSRRPQMTGSGKTVPRPYASTVATGFNLSSAGSEPTYSGSSRRARTFRRRPSSCSTSCGSSRSSSWRSLAVFAATAASTISRPWSVSSMITPRRSSGSSSRRTYPRRSSRSMRLVIPADDSMRPLDETGRREPIGRPRDAQGAQRTDLPATQAEAAEDFVLPPGEVWADAAEASRHLQRSHVEVRARFVPPAEQLDPSCHLTFVHCTATTFLHISILLANYLSQW